MSIQDGKKKQGAINQPQIEFDVLRGHIRQDVLESNGEMRRGRRS